MSNLSNNTKSLEQLLQKVNSLPDAGSGGTDTSDATASADEIFAGETAYTAEGKVTGTFTIDAELNEQNDLISQISSLIVTKGTPTVAEDVTDETNVYTSKLASLENAVASLEQELEGKAAGGGSSSIETCTVTLGSIVPPYEGSSVWYSDGTGEVKQEAMPDEGYSRSIRVLKNSIVYTRDSLMVSGNATKLETIHGFGISVYGDANLDFV